MLTVVTITFIERSATALVKAKYHNFTGRNLGLFWNDLKVTRGRPQRENSSHCFMATNGHFFIKCGKLYYFWKGQLLLFPMMPISLKSIHKQQSNKPPKRSRINDRPCT